MKVLVRVLATIIAALALSTCKQESNPVVTVIPPGEEAAALTSQGWASFSAGDYRGALYLFGQATGKNSLYADAYNGEGWSYARLDSLQKARQYFDVALGLEFTMIDAFAGRSFVSLALGDYDGALDAVSRVQAVGPPFYVFRYDSNISMNDLLLVKAQSYFFLRDYTAAQQIVDLLDPANQLAPSSPGYVEDLALEIEHLWSII